MAPFYELPSAYTADANVHATVTEVTFATPTTTTVAPDEGVKELAWIIPLVIGVVAILFALAVGLYFCVVRLELAVIRRCPKCCCTPGSQVDESIPLQHNGYNRNYSLNG